MDEEHVSESISVAHSSRPVHPVHPVPGLPNTCTDLLDLLTAGGPPVVILATITMSLVALVILLQNVVIINIYIWMSPVAISDILF